MKRKELTKTFMMILNLKKPLVPMVSTKKSALYGLEEEFVSPSRKNGHLSREVYNLSDFARLCKHSLTNVKYFFSC